MTDITFFSSPTGLGHVSRDTAIVQYFDHISTKFISGGIAAKFLSDNGFNVEDLYSAPKFNVVKGKLNNHLKWIWHYYNYYKKCKKIALKIIEKEKPKIVVSDEDFASISIAQEKKIPAILIADLLETKFTKGFGSFIEKKMNKSMKDIMNKSDVVIFPEDGVNERNIRRIGPIVRTTNFSREELRKKFEFNKKTIVVSIGGTNAGKFLIEKTISAIKKINKELELVIVSGPSLRQEYDKSIRNFGYVKNLHEIIFAADLIIALAGKSTIDEAKEYGTPAIFIPIKDHFEQEDNAKNQGFSFEDIHRLDTLILQKLSEKRSPVKSQGSKIAAEIIKKYLE